MLTTPFPLTTFANLPWTGKVRRLRNLQEIFQLNYSFAPTLLSLCSRWNFSENSEQLFFLFFQPQRSKLRVVQYRTERCWHVRNFHSLPLSFHSLWLLYCDVYTYSWLKLFIRLSQLFWLQSIACWWWWWSAHGGGRGKSSGKKWIEEIRESQRRRVDVNFFKGWCFRCVLCMFAALSKLDTCTGYLMWTLPLPLTERQPTEKKPDIEWNNSYNYINLKNKNAWMGSSMCFMFYVFLQFNDSCWPLSLLNASISAFTLILSVTKLIFTWLFCFFRSSLALGVIVVSHPSSKFLQGSNNFLFCSVCTELCTIENGDEFELKLKWKILFLYSHQIRMSTFMTWMPCNFLNSNWQGNSSSIVVIRLSRRCVVLSEKCVTTQLTLV